MSRELNPLCFLKEMEIRPDLGKQFRTILPSTDLVEIISIQFHCGVKIMFHESYEPD